MPSGYRSSMNPPRGRRRATSSTTYGCRAVRIPEVDGCRSGAPASRNSSNTISRRWQRPQIHLAVGCRAGLVQTCVRGCWPTPSDHLGRYEGRHHKLNYALHHRSRGASTRIPRLHGWCCLVLGWLMITGAFCRHLEWRDFAFLNCTGGLGLVGHCLLPFFLTLNGAELAR